MPGSLSITIPSLRITPIWPPGAALAGWVHVKEGAYIYTNATVIPTRKIGRYAVVGAGAVVLQDVPDYAVVVGNPARIIKYLPGAD